MRKIIVLFLTILCISLLSAAYAEVFVEAEKPADWEDRKLLKVTVFETTFHDSFMLECGGENMLLDGGSRSDYKRIRGFLEERGIDHFTYLFNTHPHYDHLEGMIYLVKYAGLKADQFVSPFASDYRNRYQKMMVTELEEAGIPYHQMSEGDKLMLGGESGAGMTLYRWDEAMEPNGLSGVLYIRFGDSTLLMTADITKEAQHWYLEHYGAEGLKCDILKAPHHGSKPTNNDFLDACDPQFAFVTSGTQYCKKTTLQYSEWRHIPFMYHSKGTIHMETDGKDWYIWQVLKEM